MDKLKEIAKKPISIIIFSSILVFLSNWPPFLAVRSGLFNTDDIIFHFAVAISAFLIMFVLPSVIIKFVFHKPLRDFGLCIPNNLKGSIKLSVIAILIAFPIIFFLSGEESFQKYYEVKQGFGTFLFLTFGAGSIYYFSEEFIFRGILFFGLWDKLKFHTFWIINLIFSAFHFGKPPLEIFIAFFLGMLFSYLSLKTKSFLPAALVHLTLAFILNTIITFYPIF